MRASLIKEYIGKAYGRAFRRSFINAIRFREPVARGRCSEIVFLDDMQDLSRLGESVRMEEQVPWGPR